MCIDYPVGTPLAYQRVGDCLTSNTATRFCWGDGVSSKESAARRGFQSDALSVVLLTGPTVATMSTSRVVKDEGMGVTYMDTMTILVVEGDPQWPQTGGLDPGAHNTRCHRPHLRSNWKTAFGQ